jgi:hypothetical protein
MKRVLVGLKVLNEPFLFADWSGIDGLKHYALTQVKLTVFFGFLYVIYYTVNYVPGIEHDTRK